MVYAMSLKRMIITMAETSTGEPIGVTNAVNRNVVLSLTDMMGGKCSR